jgi:hypothetical protein
LYSLLICPIFACARAPAIADCCHAAVPAWHVWIGGGLYVWRRKGGTQDAVDKREKF